MDHKVRPVHLVQTGKMAALGPLVPQVKLVPWAKEVHPDSEFLDPWVHLVHPDMLVRPVHPDMLDRMVRPVPWDHPGLKELSVVMAPAVHKERLVHLEQWNWVISISILKQVILPVIFLLLAQSN
jgi:hypothetical protein